MKQQLLRNTDVIGVMKIILCPRCKGNGKIQVRRTSKHAKSYCERKCPKCNGIRVIKEIKTYESLKT